MTQLNELVSALSNSLNGIWGLFVQFVPILLLAIILFIVGILIASVVGKAIAQVISITKIDQLFKSAGMEEFLSKIGMKLNIGKFFGVIVKWFLIIVFLMASLQIVGLTDLSMFIGKIVLSYLPSGIITIIILILTIIIADITKRVVLASSKAANVKSAETLSSIAKYAIWVFAIMIILPQLGIDTKVIEILISGVIGGLALAFGLAFGLGGKEAAARAIDSIQRDMSAK